MHREAFHIGGLAVYWYGVMVALGFLAGIWTASRRALHDKVAPEKIVDMGPWLIVGALVGARLVYVITYWEQDFASAPWYEVFMIRKGGAVFYGGFIGASLACVIFCRMRRLPLWKMADILAPSISLGYAFGRVGCFLNGCCHGRTCDLPWAVTYPEDHITWPNAIHPTQIYEALAGLGLYLLLAWWFRRKHFDGQIFALYVMGYAASRFCIEFFRGDYTTRAGGWATQAQVLSLILFPAGAALLWHLGTRNRPASGE